MRRASDTGRRTRQAPKKNRPPRGPVQEIRRVCRGFVHNSGRLSDLSPCGLPRTASRCCFNLLPRRARRTCESRGYAPDMQATKTRKARILRIFNNQHFHSTPCSLWISPRPHPQRPCRVTGTGRGRGDPVRAGGPWNGAGTSGPWPFEPRHFECGRSVGRRRAEARINPLILQLDITLVTVRGYSARQADARAVDVPGDVPAARRHRLRARSGGGLRSGFTEEKDSPGPLPSSR
jgi:hypothetical protein